MVRETLYEEIPIYLRATTILVPQGHAAAEVVAAVDLLRGRRQGGFWHKLPKILISYLIAGLLKGFGPVTGTIIGYGKLWEKIRRAFESDLVKESQRIKVG